MKLTEEDAEKLLEAIRILNHESIGDFIYTIRDRIPEGWTGSSWEHPSVVAYGKACSIVALLADKYR